MTPLVSVMIPCYNASKTLPLAIASVVAQTYSNWECILVDDGSTDDTSTIGHFAEQIEPRIKYVRLKVNYGRAIARQTALDLAAGSYLTMVDADDWIYPSKFAAQVHVMETHSDIALVSTGLAIVDANNDLLGVRLTQENELTLHSPLCHPKFPMVAHAPSMIRTEVARLSGYNRKLRRAEDVDFLLRILMKMPFGTLGAPLYAYGEHYSLKWREIINSQWSELRIFNNYLSRFPLDTLWNMGVILTKLIVTTGINMLGQEDLYARLRPLAVPTPIQSKEFDKARHWVFTQGMSVLSYQIGTTTPSTK